MAGLKTAFVLAFFAIVVLPTLQMVAPISSIAALLPLEEKRNLEPVPDFAAKLLHGDGRLSKEINKWFDDRVGFRPLFVRLQHQIDYWLFRDSENIFVGREGWLYQPGFAYGKIAVERQGEELLARVRKQYFELARYLAHRNIRLIVIGNPDKPIIYPQFMPYWAPRLPHSDAFQKLRTFLKERPEWIFIDGQDLLESRCPGHQTFQFVDIHMTFPGSVCFARELVVRVAAAEKRLTSPWDHHFTYSTQHGYGGGQSDFLALLFPPTQPLESPNPVYGLDDSPPEGQFVRDPEKVFEFTFHARAPHRAGKLPGIVMFGDSFLDQYRTTGIFTYFTEISRARRGVASLETVLQKLPPDTRYFVFQSKQI